MPDKQLEVLIVGASIAGPSTAYWLSRAGARVTVIERYPHLRPGGQNIDIRTTGVKVMRKVPGMEDAVRSLQAPIDGISCARSDGSLYGVLGKSDNPDRQALVSEYEIFRDDLATILFDLTKDDANVEYVFDEQVSAIRQSGGDDQPVSVDFLNGRPSATYDLIVACDGSGSRTRALGLECSVREHVRSFNFWAAYATVDTDLLAGSRIAVGYGLVGGRTVQLASDREGKGRVIFIRAYPKSDQTSMDGFRQANKSQETLKALIRKDFASDEWRLEEILKWLDLSENVYAGEVVKVKVPSLHKGRFVLVGDAGYGSGFTGTGTTLAMTGGYVLAGEITRHVGNLDQALKAYEDRMRPIIDDMQKSPDWLPSALTPQTWWGVWLRNNLFGLLARSGIIQFVQTYFSGAFEETDKFPLEDYEGLKIPAT